MQPVDLPQYQRISGTAAGTTTLLTAKGNFYRVIVPTAKTGTATFYDQNAGSASTSLLLEVSNNIAGSVPPTRELNFRVRNGLTCITGGTTDFVVVYG